MLFSRSRDKAEQAAADAIYAMAVSASRRPALYSGLQVPDTLDGRFEMLALSLFPPLDRLMHEPGDDPDLARRVSETLVGEMDATYREMGIGDTTVPKKMKTLYRAFAGRFSAYRAGLAEGEEALVAAIARNVFPDGAPSGSAEALARLTRETCAAVRQAPLDDLRKGDVAYPAVSAEERIP